MVCLTSIIHVHFFSNVILAATTGEDDPESFQWMSKDHLCILVYLVRGNNSMFC